ncbi:MAG: hypothetical protein J7L90_00970 [Dehalococcoidia bacterium]|nr:hypothetical protein [Dehalococcoidia bacterium]
MAYLTSSATDVDGLLDAIRLFAIDQGWTANTHEAITDGMWLHLSKGVAHFDLYTDNDAPANYGVDFCIRGATGYDGGAAHTAQPGARTDTLWVGTSDLGSGPFVAHHLFAGDDFIHCVVEISSGRYAHLGFGTLEKAGVYDGGEYCYGTRWYLDNISYTWDYSSAQHHYPFANSGAQVRFTENDLDGSDTYKDWAVFSLGLGSTTGTLYASSFDNGSGAVGSTPIAINANRQPNYFNGISMLIPFTIACGRANNLTCILGAPKELRYINIKYLTSGQELTLGSDTWLIFPTKQKGEGFYGGTTPFSLWHGMAYKKVV